MPAIVDGLELPIVRIFPMYWVWHQLYFRWSCTTNALWLYI